MSILNQKETIRVPKLSYRVYAGFGIVLVLLGFTAYFSYLGMNNFSDEFLRYRDKTSHSISYIEINNKALELQRNVQLYTFSGYEGASSKVQLLSGELLATLQKAKADNTDHDTLDTLDRMIKHLQGYMVNFEEVVKERRIRSELVQDKMNVHVVEIEEKLSKIRNITDSDHLMHVEQMNKEFYAAQNTALQFLANPDSSLVNKTKSHIYNIELLLRAVENETDSYNIHKEFSQTFDLLESYNRQFIRAVQATRAYLFLANVVMAGEAAEFVYNSEKLQSQSLKHLDEIQKTTLAETDRYKFIGQAILGITITIGILCSWLIARSIVEPIVQITETFIRLAKGEQNTLIPGTERADEIGKMAQAASIFKEKNNQTQALLKESQELTKQLNEKGKELEKSNNELEQFVYTVSHDLKSPLVTSQGFIGMIRDLAGKGEYERAFKKLEKLDKSNKRMSELISDLLDLSRVGRVNLETSPLKMDKLVQGICENLENETQERGFTLLIKDPLPDITANESRTIQVFDNLINNALKYGNNPSNPLIEIGGRENGEHVDYFVRDHGPGIPKEYQEKIFRLFQRLENDGDGTGIGLSIVHKVMESHHGKAWVESEKGEGATFWIRYPKNPELIKN